MRLWWMVAIGLLAAPAARADLFDQNRHVKAQPGQPVQIGSHARWDKRCQPAPAATIFVSQAPANGAVTTQTGTKIAHGSVGSVSCDGREFPAMIVMYQSKPGFHGVDVVRYSVDYGQVHTTNTVTIDVQ